MNIVAAHSDTLPALVDRAAAALTNARSSAEVLEAHTLADFAYDVAKRAARIGRAKEAHDTLVAAALRAQSDALIIEAQAAARLANEYDGAQERGEVARLGTNQTQVGVPDGNTLSTAADIGLTRKFIHEARIIRDAELASPGIVRRTLDEALERGEEPNKARLREAVIHAARTGAAGFNSQTRRNPSYIPPSALSLAETRVSSALMEIVEIAQGWEPGDLLRAMATEQMRADFIDRARTAHEFLAAILETEDA